VLTFFAVAKANDVSKTNLEEVIDSPSDGSVDFSLWLEPTAQLRAQMLDLLFMEPLRVFLDKSPNMTSQQLTLKLSQTWSEKAKVDYEFKKFVVGMPPYFLKFTRFRKVVTDLVSNVPLGTRIRMLLGELYERDMDEIQMIRTIFKNIVPKLKEMDNILNETQSKRKFKKDEESLLSVGQAV